MGIDNVDRGDFEPAAGERRDWRDFWVDHSNCGGTWVYIKDPSNPRVVCSCGIEEIRRLAQATTESTEEPNDG